MAANGTVDCDSSNISGDGNDADLFNTLDDVDGSDSDSGNDNVDNAFGNEKSDNTLTLFDVDGNDNGIDPGNDHVDNALVDVDDVSLSPLDGIPYNFIAKVDAYARTVSVMVKLTFGGFFGGKWPPPVADAQALLYVHSLDKPVRMLCARSCNTCRSRC